MLLGIAKRSRGRITDVHIATATALNLIHSATPHSTNEKCGCVVHSVFGGQLRSDVQCGQCGNVTQSLDPVLDLSLDLRSGLTHAAGMNTLIGCLKRYVSTGFHPSCSILL